MSSYPCSLLAPPTSSCSPPFPRSAMTSEHPVTCLVKRSLPSPAAPASLVPNDQPTPFSPGPMLPSTLQMLALPLFCLSCLPMNPKSSAPQTGARQPPPEPHTLETPFPWGLESKGPLGNHTTCLMDAVEGAWSMARAWPVGWESCVGPLWLRSRLGRTEDHGHLPYVPGQSFQESEDSEFESDLPGSYGGVICQDRNIEHSSVKGVLI